MVQFLGSTIGYNQTREFLDNLDVLNRANRAEDFIEQLRENGLGDVEVRERVLQKQRQARYGDPKLFEAILSAVAQDFGLHTAARGLRSHIMLRTEKQFEDGSPTRVVVYSHGMVDPHTRTVHGDSTLEIAEDGGCSGQAWHRRRPAFADLEKARRNPAHWKMTPEQHSRVPADRKSMLSVPIWAYPNAESDPQSIPIGTLSVDSETPLADTGWIDEERTLRSEVVSRLMLWENVVRKLFN